MVVQWEDGDCGHTVIVEPNSSDHKGHSYTIWVMKTDWLIICTTKQNHPSN